MFPFFDRAAALLAPPVCAACRRACDPSRRICESCRDELAAMPAGRARRGVYAAFPYAGAASRVVGALKFRNAPAVATEMAELMLPRLPAGLRNAGWIVPVPPHPARRRIRGYNQSLLIAGALAGAVSAPVVDCLRRAPVAPPQSELSRARRLELPHDAITLDHAALRTAPPAGAVILLCDDVVTTGVTLERCAAALRQLEPISLADFPTNVAGCDRAPSPTVRLEGCTQARRERQPETDSALVRAVTFASAG